MKTGDTAFDFSRLNSPVCNTPQLNSYTDLTFILMYQLLTLPPFPHHPPVLIYSTSPFPPLR